MLNWVANFQWLSACVGVELRALDMNSFSGRLCSISVSGKQLTLDSKVEATGNLSVICEKIQAKLPIAITLSGKGIIIKKTDRIEEISIDSVGNLFPDIDFRDFYFQNFKQGLISYVCIARKEYVDSILKDFAKSGHQVLTLSLGPFVFSNIMNQFPSYQNDILFDGHFISFTTDYFWDDYRFISGNHSEVPLRIENEIIPDQFILAYASAFQLMMYKQLELIAVSHLGISANMLQYSEERKFKTRAVLILGLIFILLFVNILTLGYFESRNEVLSSQISQNNLGLESSAEMNSDIQKARTLLQNLGWNKGIRYAWICDQIGKSVPSAIVLEQLEINPVRVNNNVIGAPIKQYGVIRIEATTTNISSVNSWINGLKNYDWVKEVALDQYNPSRMESDYNFTMIINY